MNILKSFKKDIFSINNFNFEAKALELFNFQAQHNEIYKLYINSLKKNPKLVKSIEDIPFLPIDFFKYHQIKTGIWPSKAIFESSGTSNQITSKHHIEDPDFYHKVALNIFKSFYDNLEDYHLLALLPSYLERNNSSLVSMVDYFIRRSGSEVSGFYLKNHKELINNINKIKEKGKRNLFVIGVTFALLDLAEENNLNLDGSIIMETGGMKGRREEMIRKEVHDILKTKFNVSAIHSEYGMTELLSQAYATNEGIFKAPPWMKVLIRDLNDPFSYLPFQRNGGINIIDLANIHSCAFIETSDIGLLYEDNSFEVLGRFDNSDIRGCNLLSVIS